MRLLIVVAAALIACALGALQAVATVAVRTQAAPAAWVTAVTPGVGARVERSAASSVPMPGVLRVLLARAAVRDGDFATAEAALARIAPGVERAELAALVRERRGDASGAADAYLSAGDLSGLERRIDALIDEKDVLGALALARAAAKRLDSDREQRAEYADALWVLGRVEQLTSYLVYPGAPDQQAAAMHRSLAAYEKAVALAPYSTKFLLAAGAEEQNLGALDRAQSYYARAQAVDPAGPDAYASQGEIALLRGDRTGAEALLAKARALDPASTSASRLAQKLAAASASPAP